MSEQLPRHDGARRAAEGSRPHDLGTPAVLHATVDGQAWERHCESAADAMLLAAEMLHRKEGIPDRIVFPDGTDIGPVAIRQEYERMVATGKLA